MTRKERKQKRARLDIIRRQWEWHDRQTGYTGYRHGKPAYQRRRRKPNPVIGELAFLLGTGLAICLILAL